MFTFVSRTCRINPNSVAPFDMISSSVTSINMPTLSRSSLYKCNDEKNKNRVRLGVATADGVIKAKREHSIL
jgi:hypothetical protein